MNKTRMTAAVLATALTASLGAAALALEDTAPENAVSGYSTAITLNGTLLESYAYTRELPDSWETEVVTVGLGEIPAVPAGYIPLRAVAQADRGSASWYPEESMSIFYLNNGQAQIITKFTDMSIQVNGETAAGVSAILLDGVTYIPVSVLSNIEGVTVTDTSADGGESYEITTVNGTPLMKLAYSLMNTADIDPFYTPLEELDLYYAESYGLKSELIAEGAVFLPMMTTPATLMIGKPAEGKTEELKAALEAYRKGQEDTFSWYLSQNLPMVQDARFVTEGDWFLFLIGNNADAVVEQFKTAISELN